MTKPGSSVRRLSLVSGARNNPQPFENAEIAKDPECAAAYIAQMAQALALLANQARFPSLAELLIIAQIEAELWSRQRN